MIKKILIVVGTRPNFIKVTQFKKVGGLYPNLDIKIVHTGQHFDEKMADVFFKQFNLQPDFYLNIPQVTPNAQMAEIMLRLEKLIKNEYYPDLVIVVGDVNSTLAGALTANKLNIKLAHLESGLRSFDRTMPEEINRIVTDEITDYFFVTEQSGVNNLINEGKLQAQIFFVGNTMIDTLVNFQKEIKQSDILSKLNLLPKQFVLMTMHRPATVDTEEGLLKLVELLNEVTKTYKVVFPIHPRTIKKLGHFKIEHLIKENPNVILTDPLDYFAFQNLIENSKFVITDSGGIQEESTYVQVPCLTLRPNTERPVTFMDGTNTLVPFDVDLILSQIKQIENLTYKKGVVPVKWDGKSTERILEILKYIMK